MSWEQKSLVRPETLACPAQVEPLAARVEVEGDEAASDSVQRDERRLALLGRRAVEMYVMSHIFLDKLAVRPLPQSGPKTWL